MSEVRLVIRDARRDIYADRHGSFAERVVAALSAEPETIEELDAALERFHARGEGNFFRGFRSGIDDRPYDAGLVVVDLAARLVVCESTYFSPGQDGYVAYHDGHCATDVGARYHLADDWLLIRHADEWQAHAEPRRRERAAAPPLDSRAVLYGKPLLEFLARECWEAFHESSPLTETVEEIAAAAALEAAAEKPAEGDTDSGLTPPTAGETRFYNALKEVHARWLTMPLDDLRGKSPRDVLLERRRIIDWDLQDRAQQWSQMGRPAPALDRNSTAFRCGGFGTHENVTYYYLVRALLSSCHDSVCAAVEAGGGSGLTVGDFLTSEVSRLAQNRDAWLDAPDPEFSGRKPRSINDNERRRMPEGMTGHEAVIDCDCPLCQMQADMPGPVFWNLDGCNMDDEFAFSSHRTPEEWDAEQRRYEEHSHRYEAERAERERLGVKYPGEGYADPDYVWQRSFSAAESSGAPAFLRLFAIGSHLAELTADLKQPYRDGELPAEPRELIDQLSRAFSNLREVAQSGDEATADALFEPVLARFCEALDAVASARPDIEAKSADLQSRLGRFLEPPQEEDDSSDAPDVDGMPF